jgi:hypothetical protein
MMWSWCCPGTGFCSSRTLRDAARPDKSANSDGTYRRSRYGIEAPDDAGIRLGALATRLSLSSAPQMRSLPVRAGRDFHTSGQAGIVSDSQGAPVQNIPFGLARGMFGVIKGAEFFGSPTTCKVRSNPSYDLSGAGGTAISRCVERRLLRSLNHPHWHSAPTRQMPEHPS